MAAFLKKQRYLAFAVAVLLYGAIIAGVALCLFAKGEETVQRRLQMTPQAKVSLVTEKPATPEAVPQSWQEEGNPVDDTVLETGDTAQEEVAETIAAEQNAEKTVEEVTPPAAKTEQPAQEQTPVATETTPAEMPPAVVTNPLDEASPAVSVNTDAQPVPDTHVPVWKRYARPFDAKDTRPRIALVIADLGLARNATDVAVQELPGEVTLAFSSLVPDLENWIAKSRAAGHEILLTIPMEPANYPQNDPGPNALLLASDDAENVARLQRALQRGTGFVGIMPYMGEKFVTNEEKMTPVMQLLREKEMLVLDNSLNGSSVIGPLARLGKMPFMRADLKVDAAAAIGSIEEQLANLEKIAKERGFAVGVAMPFPVTFERVKAWIAELDKKGIALAPLTSVVTIAPSPVQVVE